MRHNAPGRYRADTLNETAAQVFLQPRERSWLRFLSRHDLELPPILWVFAPVAREAQRLARMDVWKATQDSDEVTFPRCFEPGHGVAGIFSVIGYPLHDALQVFCGRVRCSFNGWIR